MTINLEKVALFRKTLLRVRPDIHAHPWQRKAAGPDGKRRGGWAPACDLRFDAKLCPLSNRNDLRGTCGDCPNRRYAALSDEAVWAHLTARTPVQDGATDLKEHLGIYLLFPA